MNHAKKESHMLPEPLQTLRLALRLAVTDAEERHDRRDIQHRQRVRVLRTNFSGRDQGAKNSGMIVQHAPDIAPGVQRRHSGERNCSMVIMRRKRLMVSLCRE